MEDRSRCTECGRVMSTGDNHRRCKMCRMKDNPKEEKIIHHYDANPELDKAAKEAFEAGMSYGKYMMYLQQKGKK